MYSNIDETSGNFLSKWPTIGFFLTYFGEEKNIRPMRPIFYTPLKVAPMGMKSKIEVNPVETFSDKII